MRPHDSGCAIRTLQSVEELNGPWLDLLAEVFGLPRGYFARHWTSDTEESRVYTRHLALFLPLPPSLSLLRSYPSLPADRILRSSRDLAKCSKYLPRMPCHPHSPLMSCTRPILHAMQILFTSYMSRKTHSYMPCKSYSTKYHFSPPPITRAHTYTLLTRGQRSPSYPLPIYRTYSLPALVPPAANIGHLCSRARDTSWLIHVPSPCLG